MDRLFFALEIHSIWPETYPTGRILEEKDRHLTLAFLGNVDFEKFPLKSIPQPKFRVGFAGKFDQCLFLPKKHPRVCALHVQWFDDAKMLNEYQKELAIWLHEKGFPVDSKQDFLPHVTVARVPTDLDAWRQWFQENPAYASHLHLYKSLGNSKYESLWKYEVKSPFEEIEHTADIGFFVRGETMKQLFTHAFTALCFTFPPLLAYESFLDPESLEDIVMALNQIVSRADQEIGCPFKAVSFHGQIQEKDNLLEWEMIIDV